ncbi:MAG: transcriptional regulator, TraR/DksA family [Dehalococcoidia bacterium]|nr:transcriptional regulator, TraR/DksA family [Dehalococcoidia bacterium]
MAMGFEALRLRLIGERKRLTAEMEQLSRASAASDETREGSPFGKREEEATETFEMEKHLALERGLLDSLAEVEHTLKKFESGTYGLCDQCGQPIPRERLEALPHASLCLKCKVLQARDVKARPSSR